MKEYGRGESFFLAAIIPPLSFLQTYRLHPLRGARRRSSSDNPCNPRQANSHARIIKVVIAASLTGKRAIVKNIVWNIKISHQFFWKSIKFLYFLKKYVMYLNINYLFQILQKFHVSANLYVHYKHQIIYLKCILVKRILVKFNIFQLKLLN